jgi:hypothetical protein
MLKNVILQKDCEDTKKFVHRLKSS